MIIYDITKNMTDFHRAFPYSGKMIRCVYDQNSVISSLTGIHKADGVHLSLSSMYGYSFETFSNPVHHHITILSNDPEKYAKIFNTKKFIIEYVHKNRADFLQNRFPTWTFVGYNELGQPRMELILP